MDPFDEIRTKPLPPPEETLYYYRKSGAEQGDPCFILSAENVHLVGGEVFIGKRTNFPDEKEMVKFFKIFFSDHMRKIFKTQKEYFGEEVFSRIRKESIRFLRSFYVFSVENEFDLPEDIEMILENELWFFFNYFMST